MKNNHIISLKNYKTYIESGAAHQLRKRYHCAVAKERTVGYCEVLIHDSYQKKVELFCLDFSSDGLVSHQYMRAEEALRWKQSNTVYDITYNQAMTLLTDAVQRSYSNTVCQEHCVGAEDYANRWEHCVSSHVQRILQEGCSACEESLEWLLQPLSPMQFIEVYLNAVNNRDAALMYDMWANSKRAKCNRSVYAYIWNHALEELQLNRYEVLYRKVVPGEQTWQFHLCISGERWDNRMLEAEMCIKLIREHGCLKVQEERVLDVVYAVVK